MHLVEIEFTARRYHATPWDAHVNEGRVEWPPCPWRLLRALLAVGYNKRGWSDHPSAVADSLVNKLAACSPEYSLPPASESHTRHYMPTRDGKSEKRVKVFDSFIRFGESDQRLLVRYDVDLTGEERTELKALTRGMSYLGRAESWIEADLVEEGMEEHFAARTWHRLATDSASHRVRLLAPLTEDEFHDWRSDEANRAADAAEAKAEKAAEQAGRNFTATARTKARAKAESPFPTSLLDSLQQDNGKWQSEGWPRPPGSRWVEYEVPADLFSRKPLTPLAQRPSFQRPEAILLGIDGQGLRGTLRPRMKRTLPLMELLHSEAVRHAGRLELGHLPELTGTNADGNPLRDAHTHAHWLPMSLLKAGAIDHVLVYAPGGFSREALQAVSAIRWAYAKGIRAIGVNMVGHDSIAKMQEQLDRSGYSNCESLDVLRRSTTWESATPLVLRKYLHRRGKRTLEGQIREELNERGFPDPISIEVFSKPNARRLKGFIMRRRPAKRQPPMERSWGITLEFPEPVRGPISLGYAGHFGMGLMRAKT